MSQKKQVKQESDSPLESLRIAHTEMNQDEFIVHCGFSRATYMRWISGKTPPKPTPDQLAALARVCKISLTTLFRRLGVDLSGIPEDLPPVENGVRSRNQGGEGENQH